MYPKVHLPDYFEQESERLRYRKLSLEDIPEWAPFFIANPNLPYLGSAFPPDTEAAAREWIERQLERYSDWGMGHLGVIEKKSSEFIGMCGILAREIEGRDEYEIAYSLKPSYWRKGYGTEMARQMRRFGEQHKLAPRFVSMIHPDNEGSIKVARNNGMIFLFDSEYLGMPVVVYGDEI